MNEVPLYQVPLGSILTRTDGLISHKAVFVGGETIFENAKWTGPRLVSFEEFAQGKVVVFEPPKQPFEVIQARVKHALSERRKYDVLVHNCEDSANWVATGRASSPQRGFWLSVGALALVVYAVSREDGRNN